MRVLGVDPGSAITGYGVVETRGTVSNAWTAARFQAASGPLADRLMSVFEGLTEVIETFHPAEVVIENAFLGKNVRTLAVMSQTRGVLVPAARKAGLPRARVHTARSQAVGGRHGPRVEDPDRVDGVHSSPSPGGARPPGRDRQPRARAVPSEPRRRASCAARARASGTRTGDGTVIGSLHGRLARKSIDEVTLKWAASAGGSRSRSTYEALPSEGEEATLVTHLHVREDELTLYGFASARERRLFETLIGVRSAASRAPRAVAAHARAFRRRDPAQGPGDAERDQRGGQETAERLVLELKDKMGDFAEIESEEGEPVRLTTNGEDAVKALIALGIGHDRRARGTGLARRRAGRARRGSHAPRAVHDPRLR